MSARAIVEAETPRKAMRQLAKKRGRLLQCQPEDAQPQFYTHFDCWNDEGDSDEETWEWRSPEADALAMELAADWQKSTGKPFVAMTEMCLANNVDQVEWARRSAVMFTELGYDVYDSDTMLEVYLPGDVPADCE